MTGLKQEEEEHITSIGPDGLRATSTVYYYSDGTAHIQSKAHKADGSKVTTIITQLSSYQVESYISELHGTAMPGEHLFRLLALR